MSNNSKGTDVSKYEERTRWKKECKGINRRAPHGVGRPVHEAAAREDRHLEAR